MYTGSKHLCTSLSYMTFNLEIHFIRNGLDSSLAIISCSVFSWLQSYVLQYPVNAQSDPAIAIVIRIPSKHSI